MAIPRKRIREKMPCYFCKEQIHKISYRDSETLKKYLTDYGRITPRYVNGNCAKCQRKLAHAIKLARFMAILPYVGSIHSGE